MEVQVIINLFGMIHKIASSYGSFVHSTNKFLRSNPVAIAAQKQNLHEVFHDQATLKIDHLF
jgi:hypothetical protein